MHAFSLLDLSPITEGGTARDALLNSRELARHAERMGYKRFWLAEHHNFPGVATAATSVALGFVAEGTTTIEVGAAGVMLPNHSPLVIAEHYGTLASLYPGRIHLGLGRAPGTDAKTVRALRRDNVRASETFPQDVQELQAYFHEGHNGVKAVPGHGLRVPLWILGSGLFGAQLAAYLGLPYLHASHFSPDTLDEALTVYRQKYRPSAAHPQPYAGASINVCGADTPAEAERMKRGMMQRTIYVRRGQAGQVKPPVDDLRTIAQEQEIATAENALRESAVGSAASVSTFIERFVERTRVDELIVTCHAYEQEARVKSFGIAADVLQARADR